MDASAIKAIQHAALEAASAYIPAALQYRLAVLPEKHQLHDLEKYGPLRDRYRGRFKTSALGDFVQYVLDNQNNEVPQVFISPDETEATAFMNLGTLAAPGHGDHTATLALANTPEWAALEYAAQNRFTQQELIEWLQDWQPQITALEADLEAPMPHAQALAAIRQVTIKATAETTSTQEDFRASRSTLEDVEASSKLTLPSGIRFTAAPCEGLPPQQVIVRLSVLTASEKPMFRLRPMRFEAVKQAVLEDFKAAMWADLSEKARITIGHFAP